MTQVWLVANGRRHVLLSRVTNAEVHFYQNRWGIEHRGMNALPPIPHTHGRMIHVRLAHQLTGASFTSVC